MKNKSIQKNRIIEFLNVYYGIDVQEVKRLSLGADQHSFVYKADSKKTSYFVKLKYGNQDEIAFSMIKLLEDCGIKEIIYPLQTLQGQLFEPLDDFKIIVYPFIDAPNGFNQHLTDKQWELLGKTLKNVHGISIPNSQAQKLRKEYYSPRWREIVRSLYPKIKLRPSDDTITTHFKLFFNDNADDIHRLVDSAEALSKKINPDLSSYVLCHSDIHAGNVLVAGNDMIYIIDWYEPMLAPKERDLMFMGGGVGNVWNKPHETRHFYKGYGNVNIDNIILSYYRHERIIEDIALYGQDLLLHEQSDLSRLEMLKHFKAMFDANGVFEIAFGTLINN